MNTWTSDRPTLRAGVLSGALVLLSGCLSVPTDVAQPADGQGASSASLQGGAADEQVLAGKPVPEVPLVGGDVILRAPEGYCVDLETVENRRTRAFAMIAGCQILSNGQMGGYVPPVLVTATVGSRNRGASLPTPEQIATSAGSDLLGGTLRDGVSVAQLAQGGDATLDGGDPRHWRAVLQVGGRRVGLALYAPEGSAMAASEGGAFLLETARSTLAASADAAQPEQAEPALPLGTDEANAAGDNPTPGGVAPSQPRQGLGAAIGSLFNGDALR